MQRTRAVASVFVTCVFALGACSQTNSTLATVAIPSSVPQDRVATKGDTVAVHYTGTLDSGEEFDSSRKREPLSFVLGSGQMISGFDASVHRLKVGDTITVRLEPTEAYGERDDDLILEFPIGQLPSASTQGGTVFFQGGRQGVIVQITDEVFLVDTNHRLAGQALIFEIELISIQ